MRKSKASRLGLKILYWLAGSIILASCFFILILVHPQSKKFVQGLVGNIKSYIIIQKNLYQHRALLDFLPAYFAKAFVFNSFELTYPETLSLFTSFYKKSAPRYKEVLIFTIKSPANENQVGAILRLAPAFEENWQKTEKVIKLFWSVKFPFKKTITLPDGTTAEELVPDESLVSLEKISYEGIEIKALRDENLTIVFAQVNEYVIISDSLGIMKDIISAPKTSTKKTALQKITRCLGENPNQLFLLNKDQENDQLYLTENIFLSLLWGRNEPRILKCI